MSGKAYMTCDGLDKLADRLEKLGLDLQGDLGDQMLLAGAEVVKQEWIAEANARGVKASGEMIDHIGYNKKPKTVRGLKQVEVYPMGTDSKRVIPARVTRGGKRTYSGHRKVPIRNATKAFFTNYKENKATGWVDQIHTGLSDKAAPAMEAVLDRYIQEKGL